MGVASAKQVRRPWYADGLRFECGACGRCCGGGPGYVWMAGAEAEAMARHLGLEPAEFRRLYARRLWRGLSLKEKANYDCILLDASGRCSAYPVRPRQCRVWPFWPSNLRSPSAWDAARERCPGIGRGQLWTLEEIEVRREEMTA